MGFWEEIGDAPMKENDPFNLGGILKLAKGLGAVGSGGFGAKKIVDAAKKFWEEIGDAPIKASKDIDHRHWSRCCQEYSYDPWTKEHKCYKWRCGKDETDSTKEKQIINSASDPIELGLIIKLGKQYLKKF